MKIPVYDATPKKSESTDLRWWKVKTTPYNSVWEVAKKIEDLNVNRKQDNLRNARLYSNRQFLQLNPNPVVRNHKSLVESSRLTLNVIKSCVDTACNKISQSRPRPQFLTEGGDFSLKQKAKQLNKFVEGLFEQEKVYQLGQTVFRDSLVWNSGIIKVFHDNESVRFERCLPDEILIDDCEAYYGSPRQLHQRRFVSKDVLIEQFPKFKYLIETADSSFGNDNLVNTDMVVVIESWHLPSGKDSSDGKRMVCISNACLLEEKWDRDHFPFVFLNWNEPIVGFWGMGLVEELTGVQLEINKILKNIQNAQNVSSVPRVFVENGASVNGASLQPNPEGLSVVRYTGTAPQFLTPPSMPSEIYSHLDRLINKAYEITGVSQLSASAKKPSGIDSAVAIREYEDIQSERFVLVGQRYERFFIDLARLAIFEAKELKRVNSKYEVRVSTKGGIEFIKWKDIELDENNYILRCFPTSILPSTPAGKIQKTQELVQSGFITKEDALSLLDFPDLDNVMNLATAAYDDAQRVIDNIIEKGEYDTPEPYQNLELCAKIAQNAYLKARNNNVDEDRLELLRRYMEECSNLIGMNTQSQQNQEPIAVPEQQPTSELLPVV